MKNSMLFSLLSLFLFTACGEINQFSIYAKNNTAENLIVVFKSQHDQTGPDERSVELLPGEQKQIIYTNNIDYPDNADASNNYCKYAADYVNAFNEDNLPSKVKWCNTDIRFEVEDIGQGTFYVEYSTDDF